MHVRRKILLVAIAIVVCGGVFAVFDMRHSSGLTASDWIPGRIIDDAIFFNINTMNPGDIQNFLNAKVPTCDTNGTQPSGHSGYATRADWGRANGAPPPYTCLKNFAQGVPSVGADAYCNGIGGSTKSAADIIFNVAAACGINPQTLIVLLQKEQGLIADDWPWPIQYRSATGYGCPDTAACDSQYYGFFNQVYNAGHQFKRYIAQPDSFNFALGRTSSVAFNPNGACGSSSITMQTRATAALYNYTPYQPNGAALNNMYGTGDGCSAYGNRNFWRMFNDWFGTTRTDSFTIAISDDGNPTQYVLFGGIKQAIPDNQTKIAWGIQDYPLVTIPAGQLAAIPSGPTFDRLTRLNTSNDSVFFMDKGRRYRVTSQAMLDAWGLSNRPITNVPPGLFYVPSDGGLLTYTVKDENAATLYMVDGTSGGNTVLRPFQNDTLQKAVEGQNGPYTEVSSYFFSTIDNAVGSTLTTTKVSRGSTQYQLVDGTRLSQPSPYSSLYPGTAQDVSQATINRLYDAGGISQFVRAAGENTVYLIDSGTKHAVASPSVLYSWLQPGANPRIVNSSFVASIPTGAALSVWGAKVGSQGYLMNAHKYTVPAGLANAYQDVPSLSVSSSLMALYPEGGWTLTGFLRGGDTPEVYFLDDSGNKRHIASGDKALLMGAYSAGITIMPDPLVSGIPTAADAGVFVGDGTDEYMLEGGTKHKVSAGVKTDWGLSGAQVYSDGTLSRFSTGAALTSELRDGNNYFLIKGGRGFTTPDVNIASAWGIADAPTMDTAVVRANMFYYILSRFVRSTTDNRIFAIDNGNWYNLSAVQLDNLGGTGTFMMGLEPNCAPNTITDWTSVVVKSNSGTRYIVDGGGKHVVDQQAVLNNWTNSGALSVPTVTDGFLNLLFERPPARSTIKGDGPAVYAATNGTKRHIMSSATYQTYAPYQSVTDRLLNAMPTGSDIP